MTSVSRLRVRPARIEDTSFLVDLVPSFVGFWLPPWRDAAEFTAVVERSLRSALTSGAGVLIAEDDAGSPLGFAHLYAVPDLSGRCRAHISDIAVAESARGRGVGRALIEAAESWARERGFALLGLSAFATNEAALRFYDALGFGADTVTLIKPLTA